MLVLNRIDILSAIGLIRPEDSFLTESVIYSEIHAKTPPMESF